MDLQIFLVAFIPMFVAFDAIGIVPTYIGLANGISEDNKKKLVLNATITAIIICILFLFIGDAVLDFFGNNCR